MFANLLSNMGESIGGNIGEKIAYHLFTPAALFWLGGLAALFSIYGGQLLMVDTSQQLIWLLLGCILLIISDVIMGWFTLPLLQLLEGYHWPESERKQWLEQVSQQWNEKRNKYDNLADRFDILSADELQQYIALDDELSQYPIKESDLLPTRLGNLLRAAERHAANYGLDAIILWPRLWVLLPEELKQELITARDNLDRAVQVMAWGLLFPLWVILAPWNPLMLLALPIAAMMVWTGYQRAIQSAKIYGNFIRTAFDLYRFKLYEAVQWPLPDSREAEIESGIKLTKYIFYGLGNATFNRG